MKLKAVLLAMALAMPLGANASGAPVSGLLMIPLMVLGALAELVDGAFSSDAEAPEPDADPPAGAAGEPERIEPDPEPSAPAAGEFS